MITRAPKFLGVYSDKSGGSRRDAQKNFYFVWKLPDDNYAAQKLDRSLSARGQPFAVTASRLASGYRFEPSILAAPVSTPDTRVLATSPEPKVAELTDDTLLELEKSRKAKQVEMDMRSNFNKALRALSRPRDRKGAIAALESLAATKEGVTPAHKHMFRDFGVSLRKKSLPKLALECARRVLELAPNDDHAHFNMARILEILGMYEEADAHLRKAIELDPGENVYRVFRDYLDRRISR
ncbi:MAG: tetratricopeptide repeat protein [Desulfovibrio sp.]|nr:tetratricopeptide repeat protein [Desulfovibrio sp.]